MSLISFKCVDCKKFRTGDEDCAICSNQNGTTECYWEKKDDTEDTDKKLSIHSTI